MQSELLSPVFIVGPLRSGTTLLRLLVGNHPNILGIGEFEEAVSQAKVGEWPAIKDFHLYLRNDRAFQDHGYTIDETLNYEDLVKSFLAQAFDRDPKSIVSASIHSNFDLLPKLWPEARYIHLLRDPRDVARSCIGMGWVGNVWQGSEYWIEPEQRWDNLCEEVDESKRLEVRYESLVKDPKACLQRICDFLEVEYTDEMLNIDKISTYSKPSSSFSEQWKTKLTEEEIQLVEERCHHLMKTRGYALHSKEIKGPNFARVISLKLQNRMYRWTFNINRWGFRLWFEYNLAKRFGTKSRLEKLQNEVNSIKRLHLK